MADENTFPAQVKILLAENRTVVRIGVRDVLTETSDLTVLGSVATCTEAASMLRRLDPDVVVVGSLADCPAPIEATRRIEAGTSSGQFRFLTLVDAHEAMTCDAFDIGTDGLLPIDANPRELASAVRLLASGYSFFVSAHQVKARVMSKRAGNRARHADGIAPTGRRTDIQGITGREFDVLHLLARGYTNSEISNRLLLSESTVKSHIQSLLNKLSLRNRASAVSYAYEKGLIKVGDNLAELPLRDGRADAQV